MACWLEIFCRKCFLKSMVAKLPMSPTKDAVVSGRSALVTFLHLLEAKDRRLKGRRQLAQMRIRCAQLCTHAGGSRWTPCRDDAATTLNNLAPRSNFRRLPLWAEGLTHVYVGRGMHGLRVLPFQAAKASCRRVRKQLTNEEKLTCCLPGQVQSL